MKTKLLIYFMWLPIILILFISDGLGSAYELKIDNSMKDPVPTIKPYLQDFPKPLQPDMVKDKRERSQKYNIPTQPVRSILKAFPDPLLPTSINDRQNQLRSLSYNLSLYSDITVTPNPVKENQSVEVAVNITNTGTAAFDGTYCAAYFDSNGNFIDYIEIKENMSLPAGSHYNYSLTFHSDA
ncbi:hypothetical protein QUF70_12140, partial [Desulfobacterales bacterium HSG17]|nr:hypothetical protein [Desulfobacterales bacterium HSG17]